MSTSINSLNKAKLFSSLWQTSVWNLTTSLTLVPSCCFLWSALHSQTSIVQDGCSISSLHMHILSSRKEENGRRNAPFRMLYINLTTPQNSTGVLLSRTWSHHHICVQKDCVKWKFPLARHHFQSMKYLEVISRFSSALPTSSHHSIPWRPPWSSCFQVMVLLPHCLTTTSSSLPVWSLVLVLSSVPESFASY